MRLLRSQSGFTLPELLIVIIIVGVLAAIALPTFLGQTGSGQDAAAKSDGASLASSIEQCAATEDDYRKCDTETELFGGPGKGGLDWGGGPGQVEVDMATARTYRVIAHSRSTTQFTIERGASGPQDRSCDRTGKGACPPSGTW